MPYRGKTSLGLELDLVLSRITETQTRRQLTDYHAVQRSICCQRRTMKIASIVLTVYIDTIMLVDFITIAAYTYVAETMAQILGPTTSAGLAISTTERCLSDVQVSGPWRHFISMAPIRISEVYDGL
ncbi:hypothetical protein NEOLEDRAFT_82679 [Neolentinus lepideus HHB14362 ss-1]|uniref:Uncharacterized protein n=1 Tax=Neolentinus lepideus HHB14362 ss-1 TaxID=1314782 RepID=A0A165MZR5_9AGAM|nr:hypothetical protein NEOLEDRAFT_82679 [Neolentinus lepideus HHB14362 ss-1]